MKWESSLNLNNNYKLYGIYNCLIEPTLSGTINHLF
ncbi:Uncharacterised protein [Sphingobacterium daejeonense]|nr:Uncharacterised protein [Sphingobacterium daejeonense]